jgi:hypothetical protein
MCIACMIVGASVFSYIVANMATVLQNFNARASSTPPSPPPPPPPNPPPPPDHRNRLTSLDEFSSEHHLPKDIRKRIQQYYDYSFHHPSFDFNDSVVSDLPQTLRVEVAKFLSRDAILRVPFFENADNAFIETLVTKLRQTKVPPPPPHVAHTPGVPHPDPA